MKKEKFIPTNYGWISPHNHPVNHFNVVLLIFIKKDNMYKEMIGYFYENKWEFEYSEDEDAKESYEVKGWFPLPYNPDNK